VGGEAAVRALDGVHGGPPPPDAVLHRPHLPGGGVSSRAPDRRHRPPQELTPGPVPEPSSTSSPPECWRTSNPAARAAANTISSSSSPRPPRPGTRTAP